MGPLGDLPPPLSPNDILLFPRILEGGVNGVNSQVWLFWNRPKLDMCPAGRKKEEEEAPRVSNPWPDVGSPLLFS